ncbi:hypothetical protein R1flu_020292 [Riccia fluitans]|uniref:Uncharacterized protein n=1 Tax=Riccia fluitans TaxID=41844 RepID=A0ABD1ZPM3_9MARC
MFQKCEEGFSLSATSSSSVPYSLAFISSRTLVIEDRVAKATHNLDLLNTLNEVISQLSAAVQQLPEGVKEIFSSGVKLPLNNTFKRELLISYLDEEVMVARDKSGVPDVLVRMESLHTDASPTAVPEFVSR